MPERAVQPDLLGERLARIPPLIDMDAHVVEPPEVWSGRLPARMRERAPRIEDTMAQTKRYIAAAGVPADEVTNEGISYQDMREGCWIPEQRLADMDVNGVQAQLCFPNYPRFCGQIFLWGQGQGPRADLRPRLQRLDGRGVGGRQRRTADPAVHHPAVGR